MKRILFLSLFFLVLTSCSLVETKPVEQQIVYVDKIVQAPPVKPNDVQKPDLPIFHVKSTDDSDTIIKAYATSLALALGYSESLEKALQPFVDNYNKYIQSQQKGKQK